MCSFAILNNSVPNHNLTKIENLLYLTRCKKHPRTRRHNSHSAPPGAVTVAQSKIYSNCS